MILHYLSAVDLAEAVARLHPLVLHLPVALFVILFLLELPNFLARRNPERDTSRVLLVRLLVLSAPLAALSGWLLHEGGGYGEEVEWHEYGGFALCASALWVGYAFRKRSRHYLLAVAVGFAVMLPTAHLGGSLTHGEDFLLAPWLAQAPGAQPEPMIELPPQASASEEPAASREPTFADVQPIFQSFCMKCHGLRKRKAGLSLASLGSTLAGGDSGAILIPGFPADSLIMQYLRAPLDADEHMPPKSKSQPTPEQLATIADWIAGMGPDDFAQGLLQTEPVTSQVVVAAPSVEPKMAEAPAATPALASAALEVLRARFVHVEYVAAGRPGLWLDFEACDLEPGELRALLQPLAQWVLQLSLAGKPLDAADIEFLGELTRLERLDLRRLDCAALELAFLSDCTQLSVLKLSGTKLAESAFVSLQDSKSLERVYLWDTGLEESPLERLARLRADLQVVGASAPSDAALETEAEVLFTESTEK